MRFASLSALVLCSVAACHNHSTEPDSHPTTGTGSLTVSITSPIDHSTIAGVKTVSAAVSGGSGVYSHTVSVSGASALTIRSDASTSFDWDSRILPNGAYKLTWSSRDDAGHSGTASSNITLDNADHLDLSAPSTNGFIIFYAAKGLVPNPQFGESLGMNQATGDKFNQTISLPARDSGLMSAFYPDGPVSIKDTIVYVSARMSVDNPSLGVDLDKVQIFLLRKDTTSSKVTWTTILRYKDVANVDSIAAPMGRPPAPGKYFIVQPVVVIPTTGCYGKASASVTVSKLTLSIKQGIGTVSRVAPVEIIRGACS